MSNYSVRLLEIKQYWNDFNQFSNCQKFERSKDVQSLLNTLTTKVDYHQKFQTLKCQNIDEEIEKLFHQIQQIRALSQNIQLAQKKTIEKSKISNEQNCILIRDEVQNHLKQTNNNMIDKIKVIRQCVQDDCQNNKNIISKNKNQLIQAEQFVEKRLKHCQNTQIQSLNELTLKVNQQICQIHEYLNEKRFIKVKKQQKLKYMIDNLKAQMGKTIQKERKMGKITYQCILNLIEDFHNHVSSKSSLY